MRPFLPKEHGLWTWVGVPLLAAVGLAPGPATAVGAMAGIAGFFAFNAARRRAWAHAGAAGAIALGAGLWTVALAIRPEVAVATGLCAVLAAFGAAAVFGGALPRYAAFEVAGILTIAALAGGLAVAAGASPWRAGVAELALATWSVAGLWWVRRLLARVLPQRVPWRQGLWVSAALAGTCVAVGVTVHEPIVGAVPLFYPMRMLAHAAPRRAVEARRVGIVELGWALAATVVAVCA